MHCETLQIEPLCCGSGAVHSFAEHLEVPLVSFIHVEPLELGQVCTTISEGCLDRRQQGWRTSQNLGGLPCAGTDRREQV